LTVAPEEHLEAVPRAGGAPAIAVVENTAAGLFGEAGKESGLREILDRAGFHAGIQPVSTSEEIEAAVARFVTGGCRVIVAAGGDGTVNAVAARLAGTDRVLGVIPTGTLNHFARDLRIPAGLPAALEVLRSGVPAAVDVAEVNGRPFLNNSGLGLYPKLVEEREQIRRRGYRKVTASITAAFRVARRLPFVNVQLEVDGVPFYQSTPFVFVGNNAYELEGPRLGTRAGLNGGLLCVCIAHRQGRWGLLRLAWRALFGGLRHSHEFDMFSARELWVDSRASSLAVSLDGEVAPMAPPLHYTIRPGALRVLVPRSGGRPK
jgi:diacylglycerol kinase family enzyme